MAAWFALLQFPLLYLPLLVLGLAVYGSDFDGAAGNLALANLALLPLAFAFLRGSARDLVGRVEVRVPLLFGVLLSGFVLRPMHLGWWDEHSAGRAAGLLVLGLLSLLASLLGAARLAAHAPAQRAPGRTPAWVLLAAVWALAAWYPMIGLLGVGAGLAAAAALGPALGTASVVAVGGESELRLPGARYALFVAAVELALPVYDWQTIPGWAPHVALALLAAAAGAWLVGARGAAALRGILLALLLAALAGGLAPAFALHPLHSVVVGLALGGLVRALERPAARAPLGGTAWVLVLGLAFAHLATQNLAYAGWRLLLLVPLALLLRRAPRSLR